MTPRAGFLGVGLCCVGPGFTHHLNLRAYLAAYTAGFQQRLLNSLAPIQQCRAQAASGEHREEEASASHTTAVGAVSSFSPSLPDSFSRRRDGACLSLLALKELRPVWSDQNLDELSS